MLLSASTYWMHPLTSSHGKTKNLPAAVTGPDAASFLQMRRDAWQQSFKSIFFLLKHEKCDSFYYRSSRLTVLFTWSNKYHCHPTGADKAPMAIISNASSAFRRRLREFDIQFHTPLLSQGSAAGENMDPSEVEMEGITRVAGTGNLNDATTVVIHDDWNVHGLYDLLMTLDLERHGSSDVPQLIASVPFLGSALKQARIKHNVVTKPPLGNTGSSGEVHTLIFEGPVLPHSLLNIIRIVAKTQDFLKESIGGGGGFSMVSDPLCTVAATTDTKADKLNVVLPNHGKDTVMKEVTCKGGAGHWQFHVIS